MTDIQDASVGAVVGLWRYPVKSMMGDELNAVEVGPRGLLGDRSYALVDAETGKVASAKHPKKWPRMFDCRASFVASPDGAGELPAVRVTLPDGRQVQSDGGEFDSTVSKMLGRSVQLRSSVPDKPELEEYWPDIEGLDLRDEVTEEAMPQGTFFDLATVHVLTTGTLSRLQSLYPSGRFEARRFRPNIIIATEGDDDGFPELDWVGRTLRIGEVALKVSGPTPRCVMTTLPQGDLPRDPGILRTAAQNSSAHVGVYAEVARGGHVTRGDEAYVA